MASCPGRRTKRSGSCLATLYRCKKCGNVGCEHIQAGECTNQGFRLTKCARCGTAGQKEVFNSARVTQSNRINSDTSAYSQPKRIESSNALFAQLGKAAALFIAICIFSIFIGGRGKRTQQPTSDQTVVAKSQDTVKQDLASRANDTSTSQPPAQLPYVEDPTRQIADRETPSHQPVIDQTAEVTAGTPTIGSALDESSQITSPQLTFSPKDTIYLAIPTSTPTSAITYGTLSVRWKYRQGALYLEFFDETQRMQFSKDLVTIFKLSKPDGFPVGEYQAEIRLNSVAVHAVAFSVQ